MINETVRLFKGIVLPKVGIVLGGKPSTELLEETVRRGFVFSPDLIHNYSVDELRKFISIVEDELGLTPEEMNATFHKSWDKVANASLFQLYVEQIIHYMTTYGFESIGAYDDSTVYIPYEKLEIPEITKDIPLTVIKAYPLNEIKNKLLTLLKSGIALKSVTIDDIMVIAENIEFTEPEISEIRNKEVKIRFYDTFNVVPKNEIEFLRYVIYKSTEKTLLIKDKSTIKAIKESDVSVFGLFDTYSKTHGLHRLARIFHRFKPLWLAFKNDDLLRHTINQIRRLAKKCHKPMNLDYLNEITHLISLGVSPVSIRFIKELNKVNTFRKIRLAYALKYRTGDVDSILYRIRNGKTHVTEYKNTHKNECYRVLQRVLSNIAEGLKHNFEGKRFFIPEHIKYTLPSTEKQFTGNFPTGTSVSVKDDMVFGVHWFNLTHKTIDLDLSIIDIDGNKYGWDGHCRSGDRNLLFSGDMTSAPKPNGATELFYVQRQAVKNYILYVNNYTYGRTGETPVPFKVLVASEKAMNFGMNYMVNPNNVKSVVKTDITEKQKILGLLTTSPDGLRFYYVETNIGNSITSGNSEKSQQSRKYLSALYENAITLDEIIELSGGIIVRDKDDEYDVDLSPEILERDTIINLLT